MKKTIKPLPLRRQTVRNLSAISGGLLVPTTTFTSQVDACPTVPPGCPDPLTVHCPGTIGC